MSRRRWLCGMSLVCALSWALFACGGDDDDVSVSDSGPPDGGAVSAQNLGRACSSADLCPARGEVCLLGSGGTGFCSLLCSGPGDTACATGYTGPGAAACVFNLLDDAGNPTGESACGVVCDAPDTQCPPNVCDGTSCPGSLDCVVASAELSVCDLGSGDGGGGDAGVGVAELHIDPATGQRWPILWTRRLR